MEYIHRKLYKFRETEAFTLLELMIVLAILGILATISISVLFGTKKSAYEITAKHDLQSFSKSEEMYFTANNKFIGNVGQSVRNDGAPSDFVLSDFTPSEGISITIISGDPDNPYDPGDQLIAQSVHKNHPAVRFEYNF